MSGSDFTYGSVCSGIEAASVAWKPLGWRCSFVSEIEPFPKRVLAHHYPDVPDLGDFTEIGAEHGPVDLLVGGTPCQSFSVAGLRAGLADPRGNLMLEFGALARRLHARWIVWENVPGVLSSNGGRDFGAFLGMLGELGYGFAYAVLDAQYFGVPQRRRRVFVVGHAGGLWQRAAAVLFEPESLRGDPAPRREAREGIANGSQGGASRSIRAQAQLAHQEDVDELIVTHSLTGNGFDASEGGTGRGTPLVTQEAFWGGNTRGAIDAATACNAHSGRYDFDSETLVAGTLAPGAHPGGFNGRDAESGLLVPFTLAIRGRGEGRDLEARSDGTANAILTPNGGRDGIGVGAVAIPWDPNQITSLANRSRCEPGGPMHTLPAAPAAPAAPAVAFHVTQDPIHSEDSFPCLGTGSSEGCGTLGVLAPSLTSSNDPSRSPQSSEVTQQVAAAYGATGSVRRLTPRECERLQGFPDDYTAIPGAKDGPRYRALGNSMAVPVMAWIGRRIQMVEGVG